MRSDLTEKHPSPFPRTPSSMNPSDFGRNIDLTQGETATFQSIQSRPGKSNPSTQYPPLQALGASPQHPQTLKSTLQTLVLKAGRSQATSQQLAETPARFPAQGAREGTPQDAQPRLAPACTPLSYFTLWETICRDTPGLLGARGTFSS